MKKELSEKAEKHLEHYLKQVRDSLRGCTTVDVNEVERNIIEHIENELAANNKLISLDILEPILQKLGKPDQLVLESQLEYPWWRKIILRLHYGPEDWRLAYLSFTLFVLSLIAGGKFAWAGIIIWPALIVEAKLQGLLLFASFITSRALLAVTPNRNDLSGMKWLIYPTLLYIYIPVGLGLFFWTGLLFSNSNSLTGFWGIISDGIHVAALGLWWIILGLVFLVFPDLSRAIFRPFADDSTRKNAMQLISLGILVVILGVLPMLEAYIRNLGQH